MHNSYKFSLTLLFLLTLIFVGFIIPTLVQNTDPHDYYPAECESGNREWQRAPEAEEYVMTRLNQWRLGLDLYPLQRNELLDRVASQQANFIREFAPFGQARFVEEGNFSAWHTDGSGGSVLERLKENGWAEYDGDYMIGSEMAAYFADVNESINFWQESTVHNYTATLSGFREIGVYTQCWQGWLLTYVVFASRPDYVPAIYNPNTNALHLSDESLVYQGINLGFQPDFIQFQDLGGNRIHAEEWLLWDDVVQLPPNAPNDLVVVFTDGVTIRRTQINLDRDRIFPSRPDPTPTPTKTSTPTSTVGATPTRFTVTTTPTPTMTPPPNDGSGYDIVLYFNQDYFSLVNESGRFVNLSPLAFTSDTFPLFEQGMDFFAAPYTRDDGNLGRIAPNTCFQAFALSRFDGPGEDPASCLLRLAYRSQLQSNERFWLRPNFAVTYGLEVIAGCQGLQVRSQQLVCGFDLPDVALSDAP